MLRYLTIFMFVVALHAAANSSAPAFSMMVDGQSVAYLDSGGNGEPILFLHAGSGNMSLWDQQVGFFISHGYRFIAINYKPIENAQRHAVMHEFMAKLGIHQFHLVGTAAGGGISLGYVLKYPESVKSIVIANSTGNIDDDDYRKMSNRFRPSDIFTQLPTDFLELGPSYRAINPDGVELWKTLSESHKRMPPPPKTPVNVDPEYAITWENLAKLTMPILFLTGDADLYTPPAVVRLFHTHVPQSETYIVSDSGHSAYWESPKEFNHVVLTFLSHGKLN